MRIRKRPDELPGESVEIITSVSDALAHPVRLQLFRFIMQKNKAMELVCTRDLVEEFDYAQATVSQHMNKLAIAGLVTTRRKDKHTYYFANIGVLTRYINETKHFALV